MPKSANELKALLARARATLRRRLGKVSVQPAGHVDKNRRYWDGYAIGWNDKFRGYELEGAEGEPSAYSHLGDEWGNPVHVQEILDEFIFPFVDQHTVALEIGSGGGRIAAQVAPRVRQLFCADISEGMLQRLAEAMGNRDNVSLVHLEGAELPASLLAGELDFVYSFDVFVHLDLHTIWKYVEQISRALRPGGLAFLHTTNLRAKGGWERFASQEAYSIEGHYFITPEMLALLAERAGMRVEKEGAEDATNFYKARDYLVLLRK